MSAYNRPSSSASIPPSASAPIRPSSSISTRPPSSASARSIASTSRATIPGSASTGGISRRKAGSISSLSRPISRLTHRPPNRQSSRLASNIQELVTLLTGYSTQKDAEQFERTVDHVSNELDPALKPASAHDLASVQRHLQGHAQKARINSHDTLATAFEHAEARLKAVSAHESDLDAEIHTSRIPNHVQFLLELSNPPTNSTHHRAEDFIDRIKNPNKPPPGLTWAEILAEEPFSGQHWEGVYGLPPGSVKQNTEDDDKASDDNDSVLSLSLLDDDYDDYDYGDYGGVGTIPPPARTWSEDDSEDTDASVLVSPTDDAYMQQWSKEIAAYSDRSEVDKLRARQYWRSEWRIQSPECFEQAFNVGNASTLGHAYQHIAHISQTRYIYEHDAVREILMALQGRSNLLLTWSSSEANFTQDPKSPSFFHLTPGALTSILSSYAELATTVDHLRRFVAAMYATTSRLHRTLSASDAGPFSRTRSVTRTLEAFSEAIDVQIRRFDAWCGEEEERVNMSQSGVGPPFICSLLNLKSRLEEEFSDAFDVTLKILNDLAQRATRSQEPLQAIWTFPDLPRRMHPSTLSMFLLNSLLSEVQRASTMGDDVTFNVLLNLFKDSMAPLWKMVHRWLKDGMPIRDVALGAPTTMDSQVQYNLNLPEEFFVEDNELVLLDPDFWRESFVLRDDQSKDSTFTSIPEFLVHIAPHVLAAGKAVGLLRALGVPNSVAEGVVEDGDVESEHPLLQGWQSFDDLLDELSQTGNLTSSLLDFPKFVYDKLLPVCRNVSQTLSHALVEECEVWTHLGAIQDLYLMRRGDIMSNFLDVLFARMDTKLPWMDFHFLNTAFVDVATGLQWIDPALVRFSYRGQQRHQSLSTAAKTVRTMDGLQIEYAVPFPLTYIWGPGALQAYCSVFVFILQIRRAKTTLERILVRNAVPGLTRNTLEEMKMFYAMRGKLLWFINTMLNHICTNVLETQVRKFHQAFKEAKSLDEMIDLHNEHLQNLQNQCLLLPNTTALYQAIISILDTSLHFCDSFVAFAGDTTHDISRHTIKPIKHHRSRRLKRFNKNVIGFADTRPAPPSSESDSDSDEEEEDTDYSNAASFSVEQSSYHDVDEDEFVVRLDRMSRELDSLVRFVRRGVESLAAGSGESASLFGMFAFTLEDWDS